MPTTRHPVDVVGTDQAPQALVHDAQAHDMEPGGRDDVPQGEHTR
jgi:hypothetical protein